MLIWSTLLAVFFLFELVFYFSATPTSHSNQPLHIPFEKSFGIAAFLLAHILSLLRLPYAILPYLFKFGWVLIQRKGYFPQSYSAKFEILRLVGDAANFIFVSFLLLYVHWSFPGFRLVVHTCIWAESIRLFSEKGQVAFSGFWQCLPHRFFATCLRSWLSKSTNNRCQYGHFLQSYVHYYSLDNDARIDYLVEVIRNRAALNQDLSARLSYFHTFRIVSKNHSLRAGKVRDVALGEIFVYACWTNDPWLLIGLALRRSPWLFDPRFLHRPFYYRTESNPLTTLLVLQNPLFSWPFTIYQLGHEIKAARFNCFYRFFRLMGINLEETVQEDGTYRFEPLLDRLLRMQSGSAIEESRALWSDDEVVSDVIYRQRDGECMTPIKIAHQYTYPLPYIEEVLWPQISRHF
jgi:hypothetical protein